MRRAAAVLAIAGGVLALDQCTTRLALLRMAGRPSVDVLGEFVRLTFAQNSGVAFSLGAGTRFPFYLFSIAAAVVILWLLARGRVPRVGQQVALALILGRDRRRGRSSGYHHPTARRGTASARGFVCGGGRILRRGR